MDSFNFKCQQLISSLDEIKTDWESKLNEDIDVKSDSNGYSLSAKFINGDKTVEEFIIINNSIYIISFTAFINTLIFGYYLANSTEKKYE